jgi:periplasmic protein TonB
MHMPRDLFGTVTHPPAHIGTRSRLTLPLSLAAHAAALAALIVVPLVATDVLPLPDTFRAVVLVTPEIPVEPPKPIPPAPTPLATTPVNPDAAPVEAPTGVTPEPPARPPTDLGDVAPGSTFSSAVLGTGGDDRVNGLTPPPPPPQRAPMRVGGAITAPTKIHDVAPVYPRMAQDAKIQGVVIIQATIGMDGRVVDAEVLRPVPFLGQAALDAVRQWRFTRPQLNGEPIAVIMTVTVNFTLN